jgi:glycerate dehydrogenase
MMKIVVLDGFTLNPGDLVWDELKQIGECEIYYRTPPELVYERIKNAEIVLTNKVAFRKELLCRLPKLKYIGVLATGYNVVDINTAYELGITVTNIPAYSTDSVAQMVFAHILNFTQRVGFHSDSVRKGDWANNIDFMYMLTPQIELAGKTLGIIGFGKIGQSVAKIALSFKMKIIFHNMSNKKKLMPNTQQVDLKAIFTESDFISINCPLTDDNTRFINNNFLQLAKQSVFIINTGRGLLLNEQEVAFALNSGKIAGLGTDVLSTEPPLPDNPLLHAKNCFITPHMAWATKEARKRLMHIAVDNIMKFLEGNPENVVYPQ